ncbi:hypothetical protein ElyMa_002658100 [Elysia marginata]|uniref:Uncharacterized protein n=1 Tax=Elysia marginata TaxID=1093978 RepID=A0AAV4H7X0_9GAST|nr:hypothetical protein ElyMa_002658100 [Elysia marginata]
MTEIPVSYTRRRSLLEPPLVGGLNIEASAPIAITTPRASESLGGAVGTLDWTCFKKQRFRSGQALNWTQQARETDRVPASPITPLTNCVF